MRMDNIPKPKFLWFEDVNGDILDVDTSHGMPDFPDEQKVYMHTKILEVRHYINTSGVPDKWPVKFLRWLIKKCPNSWVGYSGEMGWGGTTIRCMFPAIKYLVENNGWSFDEAAIASSDLCERCMNICLWECEGRDLELEEHYLSNARTHCSYCKYIDPAYDERYRVWCCYRTFKMEGDVSKAWHDLHINSAPGYWKFEDPKVETKPNFWQSIWRWAKMFFRAKKECKA